MSPTKCQDSLSGISFDAIPLAGLRASPMTAFAASPCAPPRIPTESSSQRGALARCHRPSAPLPCRRIAPRVAAPVAPCRMCSDAVVASGTDTTEAVEEHESVSRFTVGDKVRVAKSVQMYHVPGSKNEPLDLSGRSGIVKKIISTVKGALITAIKPVAVRFEDPKFIAHFDDDELESV